MACDCACHSGHLGITACSLCCRTEPHTGAPRPAIDRVLASDISDDSRIILALSEENTRLRRELAAALEALADEEVAGVRR